MDGMGTHGRIMWLTYLRGGDSNVNDALDGEVLLPKGWKVRGRISKTGSDFSPKNAA